MVHKKFGDLFFMFFGALMITLLIVGTIYTVRAVVSDIEAQTPGKKGFVQEVVSKHTGFGNGLVQTE